MTYFGGAEELVGQVNGWCATNISKYKARSLFLPAGKTPEPIYKAWEGSHPEWLEEIELLQVDDIYNGTQKGRFKKFFEEHLPTYANRVKTPAQSGGTSADLAILGFGKNGHVAFHEPGLSESFFYGVIDLSDKTKNHLDLEEDAKGITYGAGAFLQAKAILLIVSGSGKEQAFQDFLADKNNRPANFLRKHPDLTVLIEETMSPKKTKNSQFQASL